MENEELYNDLYYNGDKYIKDNIETFYTSTDIDDIYYILTELIDDERFETYLDDCDQVDDFDVIDFAKYVIKKNGEINGNINENNTVSIDIDNLPKSLDDIDEPRPNRMKRPPANGYVNDWKCGRHVTKNCLYIQDEAEEIMQDKYGRERGTRMWEGSIDQGARGNAMFSVAEKIIKEKAFLFHYFNVPIKTLSNYWSISYYALWKLWMDAEGHTYKIGTTSSTSTTTKPKKTAKPKNKNSNIYDIILNLYNTVKPTEKDYDRIYNIFNRADDDEKAKKLALNMANSIKDVKKAFQRFRAAEEENYHNIASIFYTRVEDLLKQNESANNNIAIINFKKKYKHGDTVYHNGKPHTLDYIFKDIAVLIDSNGTEDFVEIKDLLKENESFKDKSHIETFKSIYPENSLIDYHGRTGTIELYLNDSAIVYFPDNGDSEDISIEELIEQNESSINERKLTEDELSYFYFLNNLRKSGITNMFAAAPYLVNAFHLSENEASEILLLWMEFFNNDYTKYKDIEIED